MSLSFSRFTFYPLSLCLIAASACSAPPSNGDGDGDSAGSGSSEGIGDDDDGGSGSAPATAAGGGSDNIDVETKDPNEIDNPCDDPDAPEECVLEAPPACGDGTINLDPPEACDDGNSKPGDGCSGACVIEPFHVCPTEGQPCKTTIVCGDGEVGPGEACDDANATAGDGCSDDCRVVEQGFSCRLIGEPCVRVFICGDSNRDPNEGCDDGNIEPGDGCDSRCRMEIGFKCDGSPSTCSATTCGDGVAEGAESCDDGNDIPFDGCTDRCQAEPICVSGEACSSSCGDGIVLNEECDDGNLRDGDGCSSLCTKEDGFECSEDGLGSCEQVNGECVLRVPALFRDFQADTVYSDFPGSTCNLTTGLLDPQLDAAGKPVFIGSSCIKSQDSFQQWYTENENNKTMPGNITLFSDGNGGYVNRLTEEGAQFIAPSGQATDTNAECAADDDTCLPCRYNKDQTCDKVVLDGNPVFFPLDDFADAWPDERRGAQVPQQFYLADGWPAEDDWDYWPEGYEIRDAHNFYFTSEVQYWFRFDASTTANLEFVGDDDMWVYINGRLAVDLGGVHTPEAGDVTIDATSGPTYGLEDGKVYPIKMFHAERKDPGSSFKLTLSGFTTGRSDCVTNCGDGEIGPGEECDDGPGNLGGYNQCTADCTLGPRCGDGVAQVEEVCDYGDEKNTGEYGGCSASCTLGPYCGDGLANGDEQCDNGENVGGYGECAFGCVLGPICGDGGWEPEFEECDDGNNIDQDGCSAACKVEIVVVK